MNYQANYYSKSRSKVSRRERKGFILYIFLDVMKFTDQGLPRKN